ncbi:hypothetical protein, partial [Adlercreutzia sp. ZJ473]|uniref:hypothetical protein n=1 Tax=Adlercreutzia sp. ZJ473 TaxID=2722822 RepID=UPI001555C250
SGAPSAAAAPATASAGGAAGAGPSAQETTAAFDKSEVVYASLSAEGAPEAAYVVNRFEVSEPGRIVDFGAYDAVMNLSSQDQLEHDGEAVAFDAPAGSFFYQGNLGEVELPWNVALSYALDGRTVDPADLAGASGKLEVRLTTERNYAADVPEGFYESYMMQITFTLGGEVAHDVAAEGATLALSGADRTAAFTVLPGHDGDFTLAAQVSDFTMPGVQIAALPYTSVIEMPDASGMVDEMSQLTSAISQLSAGTSELAGGVGAFAGGTETLVGTLNGYLDELGGVSAQIDETLTRIEESGLIESLDPEKLAELSKKLTELAEKIEELVKSGDVSLGELGTSMDKLSASSVTPGELKGLDAAVRAGGTEADAAALEKLKQAYEAAQKAVREWEDVQGSLEELLGSYDELAARLRELAAQIDAVASAFNEENVAKVKAVVAQIRAFSKSYPELSGYLDAYAGGAKQLASGADALAGGIGALDSVTAGLPDVMRAEIERMMADYEFPPFEPTSFTSDRNEHTSEVQFVLTTAAIEKPAEEPVVEEAPEPTLLDRLWALFQG